MRTPLQDVLSDHPEWEEPTNRAAAEAQLEALFAAARDRSNAYSAARLDEIYQVTERALTLANAFSVPSDAGSQPTRQSWRQRIPSFLSRYSTGLLLAASAPLVADASVLLAGACGIAAVLSLAVGVRTSGKETARSFPRPKAVTAKLAGLLSAADQSLESATAPLALADQRERGVSFAQEDIVSVLQDVLAAARAANQDDLMELERNAERMAAKAGYTPQWTYHPDFFEVMVDPDINQDLVLKPALLHHSRPEQSVFGVIVRRQS
ncbi:MAG: hypothetical protein AAFX52_14545 [Pseudomonadota bacterium]